MNAMLLFLFHQFSDGVGHGRETETISPTRSVATPVARERDERKEDVDPSRNGKGAEHLPSCDCTGAVLTKLASTYLELALHQASRGQKSFRSIGRVVRIVGVQAVDLDLRWTAMHEMLWRNRDSHVENPPAAIDEKKKISGLD
jgi:hypothetical protein